MLKLKELGQVFSEQGPWIRPPQRKGGGKGLKASLDFLDLIQSWEQVVGEHLAAQTIPLKHVRGNLTILAGHSAYSEQLSFMQEQLKQKIGKVFPALACKIKRLSFQTNSTYFETERENLLKTAGKRGPKRKKKVSPTKHHHPYDPHYREQRQKALAEFSGIKDDELKEGLIGLYLQLNSDKV